MSYRIKSELCIMTTTNSKDPLQGRLCQDSLSKCKFQGCVTSLSSSFLWSIFSLSFEITEYKTDRIQISLERNGETTSKQFQVHIRPPLSASASPLGSPAQDINELEDSSILKSIVDQEPAPPVTEQIESNEPAIGLLDLMPLSVVCVVMKLLSVTFLPGWEEQHPYYVALTIGKFIFFFSLLLTIPKLFWLWYIT